MVYENKELIAEFKTNNYDRKNKLNRANKAVSDDILRQIENGLTIEQLEKIDLPIFKYQTQITIHGIFNELQKNYINGYKYIFQNKNKSIGVKWNAIDTEKRKVIGQALKHVGIRYGYNSTEHWYQKSSEITVENRGALIKEYKDLQDKFNSVDFYGRCSIFTCYPWGRKLIVLNLQINAIYEKNIQKLLDVVGLSKEVIAEKTLIENTKREAEKQARELKYAKEKEAYNKAIEALSKVMNEQGYIKDNIQDIKQGFTVKVNYKNETEYILFNIYKPQGKKKNRIFTKKFNSLNELKEYAKNEKLEHYNDRIFSKEFKKGWKLNNVDNQNVETIENKNVKIIENKAKNGIELYFESIPSVDVRDNLKANKWRWSRYNKCWYNYNTEANMQFTKCL